MDSSLDPITGMSPNGAVSVWNDSGPKLFGCSSSEFAGKSLKTLVPEDRQRVETAPPYRGVIGNDCDLTSSAKLSTSTAHDVQSACREMGDRVSGSPSARVLA